MKSNGDDSPKGDRTILAVHSPKSGIDEDALRDLLLEASCPEDAITIQTIDDDSSGADKLSAIDVLIVVLDLALTGDERIERMMLAAAQGGCTVVGIWKPGEKQDAIHPALAKYGSAQIPWDAEKLRTAIETDCPAPFETAEGEESKPHYVKPNKC